MRLIWGILSLGVLLQAQAPQRIKLIVERWEGNGGWKEVNSALVFDGGDRLRFRISANFPGYLYVMDQGTSGAYEVLFPRAETNTNNRLLPKKEYVIPQAETAFRVAGPAGQDFIYWVMSPVALSGKYRVQPPPPSPSPTEPPPSNSLTPRCDDSILKARAICIDGSAGIKPVTPGESLPTNLARIGAPTPRDIVFTQESGGAVVSSPSPLAGPILYELRLAHR